ncbi:MAG: glycosyltransferase [Verrucomicrobia bacterium]|nr:glycosyltransferase [Verrucomicrobiota bacterium]
MNRTGSAANSEMSRADMHVHSRFSDQPSEWILRRVGAPECFTDPQTIYDRAKAAGMNFVTVSDHDEIGGALELKAKHPDEVFISEEITSYFPENGCKMHILAWDVTEAQHAEIQKARANIQDLAALLRRQGILHAVAHPFYQNNARLTLDQFEKLLLMFKHFEGLNGARDIALSATAVGICRCLTTETIAHLADRHNLPPQVDEAHVKFFTGGSDDHSSVFIARAHTATPLAKDCGEFLRNVRDGRCDFGGKAGSALTFSHSLYNIAYLYYSDKLRRGSKSGHELMVKVFENFVAGQNPAEFTFSQKIRHAARKATARRKKPEEKELSLSAQFSKLFREGAFKDCVAGEIAQTEEVEIRSFRIASRIVNELSYTFVQRLLEKFAEGNILDCLQAVSALGPIALGVAPYFVAFKHHTKDRQLLMDASRRFLDQLPPELARPKRAWFTDTLQDVNGVSHTIQRISEVALRHGKEIEVIASKSRFDPTDLPVRNFTPVGEFKLKEYEGLELSFPPILDILEHCWRQRFSEIVISTPGPVGLAGLLAARLLGLKAVGIYHTDFPQYVRVLTRDERMGAVTWKYMEWFYGAMDLVYVPSETYRLTLLDHGFASEKLKIMPRGIDCQMFSPEKRDPRFWEMFGAGGQVRFLYVGRISREKDLDILADAFLRLLREQPDALLSLIGDGPYLGELKKRLPKASTVFTGFLSGEALARAYASADVFVFPSTTDTFGNVVLEAQASGLPAIVSDLGGPRELINDGETGYVTQAKNADSLLDAMRRLAADADLRRAMSRAARQRMSQRTWEKAFEDFWPQT